MIFVILRDENLRQRLFTLTNVEFQVCKKSLTSMIDTIFSLVGEA